MPPVVACRSSSSQQERAREKEACVSRARESIAERVAVEPTLGRDMGENQLPSLARRSGYICNSPSPARARQCSNHGLFHIAPDRRRRTRFEFMKLLPFIPPLQINDER